MEDFDFGVDPSAISSHVGNNIKKWPTEGDTVLLLDADSIPYVVGYTSDHVQYLAAQNDPAGFQESQMFKDKCDHANYLINDWAKKAKADAVILFVTDNSENFRLELMPSYKEDRSEEEKPKPPFFYEIKQWLIDFHDARISYKCEADDEISIEAWKRLHQEAAELWTPTHKVWSSYVIGSMDKDLNMIPGWHVNQATGERFWVQGIGQLDPVWKVREVTNYEYHPLFGGKPVDYRKCSVVIRDPDGNFNGADYTEVVRTSETHGDKWPLEYVWYHSAGNSSNPPVKQDTFQRGPKKGVGKFKRMKAGMKDREYIDKLKGTGLSFFYAQILMGDAVDGYGGLEGCGETTAYELLSDCKTEWELYQTALAQYEKVHGDAALEKLTLMGRMAWMQTHEGEIWSPPTSPEDSSYPL